MNIFDKKTAVDKAWLENRNIYVFSDLHSGDGSSRDNFKYLGGEEQFKLCVTDIKTKDPNSVIVILGDYLEFWQSPFGAVLKNNISLMDELARLEAVYILGNHDSDLLAFLSPKTKPILHHKFFSRMGEAVIIERGNKRIALAHGHEADPFNSSPVPGKGRVVAIIAGMFEDKVGSPFLPGGKSVESALLKISEILLSTVVRFYMKIFMKVSSPEEMKMGKGLTASKNINLIRKNIEAWRKIQERGDFDILVCGHTHRVGFEKNSEGIVWYYNAGSWASRKNTYLKIDINGLIAIYEWKDNKQVLL